ncbi:MAG: pyridoxamine 5'-phosphate oxidase family protein [Robiginitomaculum sp.]
MKVYETIEPKLEAFIKAQKMFFVATAPLSGEGHVNLSPKGYDSFAILNPAKVAYLDLGGSGIETQAHITENGRITIMFCAFEGKANIVRLFGTAKVFDFGHPDFAQKLAAFPGHDRARSIFEIALDRIQDSCGWGVPFYEFKGERDQLKRSNANRSYDDWAEHRYKTNSLSIDGLPGLKRPK